jgi:glycosidase
MLISQSSVLGMVPTNQQRIFHYGRELKTLGRTLHALGVGRFTNNSSSKTGPKIVVHLHAVPCSAITFSETNDTKQMAAVSTATNNQRQVTFARQRSTRASTRATTSASIDTVTTSTASSLHTTNQAQAPEVVDLYSDDENDDIVVIVNKPNTSTSTTATANASSNQSNKRRKT